MKKNIILCMLVCLFVLWQPVSTPAADKHVSDCLDDQKDCEEETDETEESDSEQSPERLIEDETMETGSFALNIVKMVFALLLILALIYALLWFLKKRRSYEQVGALENIGGISVGQHKSVQIVRIGSKMYLLGIGDNVELLKELSEEEAEKVKQDKAQSSSVPAASFVQGILEKRKTKNNSAPQNDAHDFNTAFQKELDKLKANRHQLIDHYDKKDDEHD